MKLVLTILGVLMVLVGCVWILQGINVLPGSFMTGQMQWAIYGAVVAVGGIIVVIWARRRPAA
ncbi:MAG: hypothetical protein E7812_17855 [Phenylobacterium sp.]|nr:MAG: hypothetical protein E7812_17855 [Phenylobacterium sp.]